MKQINSVITTKPVEARSRTGTQHGERGAETPESLPAVAGQATREEIASFMRPLSERVSPQQEAQNAMAVNFELEVVSTKVDRFGWRDLSGAMKQRLGDDWTRVLRVFPVAEVRRGISDCLDDNPRRCPNEHEVRAKIIKRRGAAMQKAAPAPQQQQASTSPRLTPERAEEIMREIEAGGGKCG